MFLSTRFSLRLLAALLASTAWLIAAPARGDADVFFSDTFQEPGNNRNWREGMVTGNGIDGVIASGSPYRDTLIYQNMFFSLPSADPRENPDALASELAHDRSCVQKRRQLETERPEADFFL